MTVYAGDSADAATPAITGTNSSSGVGVKGVSQSGEGIRGESNSTQFAAIAGYELNPSSKIAAIYGESHGSGPGVYAKSASGEALHAETNSTQYAAIAGYESNPSSNVAAIYGESSGGGPAVFGKSANGEAIHGETTSVVFAAVAGITANPAGTGAAIYGESRGQGPAGYFKGNVMVTGDVILIGADCAENFDIEASAVIEPGTVVVINSEGRLCESQRQYDSRVAGVVSGAGAYRPAILLDSKSSGERRAPIAMIGKVYCKVDASFTAIEIGDLLTTSTTPGHAMKATDPPKAFGAVLGKALQRVEAGRAIIPILVALQ